MRCRQILVQRGSCFSHASKKPQPWGRSSSMDGTADRQRRDLIGRSSEPSGPPTSAHFAGARIIVFRLPLPV
jgi:hypothetical protein